MGHIQLRLAFGGIINPTNELVYELAMGHQLLHMRVRDGVLRERTLHNISSASYELDAPIT